MTLEHRGSATGQRGALDPDLLSTGVRVLGPPWPGQGLLLLVPREWEGQVSDYSRPEPHSRLCYPLVAGPWPSCLPFLILTFSTCEMGLTVPASWVQLQVIDTGIASTGPGLEEVLSHVSS